MASRSSRRKSVLKAGREHVAKLLQDGKTVIDASPEEREAARELAGMKLVEVDARVFVRCADPGDGDYPRSNRTCRGRVYLPYGEGTDAEELQCPDCGRRVYPAYYRKNRHDELRVRVLPKGVATFVHSRLVAMSYRVEPVVEGVYRVPAGSTGVYVCISELCAAPRFLAREWAVTQTTCYIFIDADGAEDQFLAEDWVKPVALADLLTGGVDLHQRIEFQALSGQPAAVRLASVPIYPRWARPVLAEPPKAGREGRRFVVEVCGKVVRVEGVRVIAPKAGPRLEIFRILWDCFLDDLKSGMPPE